ncbi:MAG: glutamate dehydrogenase [Sphingomonadales bacterium 32-68-7]|nr:MAG: glutamate dehydrogenase [Sphingomonadales bacterium 12-68-11]OYX08261.1 MAG: glutamate dehydrogenase [Sphingomonadales bacterium 32-68-7]
MATAKRTTGEGWQGLSAKERALAASLRERMAHSLLPGDSHLTRDHLDRAAAFLLEAALTRAEGEAAILVRSDPGARLTRIAIVNKDMPFLVDSIAATIAAAGIDIDLLVHPILAVRRDADGRLSELPEGEGAGEKRESMVYLETQRIDARERRALERELAVTLGDVRAAVTDWPQMTALIGEDADRVADAEGAALLRWLGEGNLTQLGHLTRRRDGRQSQLLGVCRKSMRDLLSDEAFELAFAWFEGKGGAPGRVPLIVKANHLSRVHRRVPLDLFIVPILERGSVAALSVHAGIWTSAALGAEPHDVPVLRRHLATLIEKFGFALSSHDGKALVHALTALPHDLVIGFADADLERVATTMMAVADRPRPRLAMVAAPLQRHVFAFVWLPRDTISTATRLQVQNLLEGATGGKTLDWSLLVEGGALAMLRFVLDFRGVAAAPDHALVDTRLQEMLRGWGDAVEAELAASEDTGRAAALAARYAESFPAAYRTAYGPGEAARDIARIRRLAHDEGDRPLRRDVRLYRHADDAADELRLKVYQFAGAMPLSDVVPALENFGYRVLAEIPTELAGPDTVTIHDFRLSRTSGEEAAPLLDRAEGIEQAICAVLNGKAENDVFNRLVTGVALSANEAEWLRAFYRYLRQTQIAFTIDTVVNALRRAPGVTRALVDLFRVRHDPTFGGDRAAATAEAEARLRAGLADVAAINDDRLLRLYWATIGAVLRTNAFAPAGIEALAFKLDSAKVPSLPRPVPWREIFVYSRRVEGIHLRAGPVARGGLRWSDRRDDFRTEILGLMKAQRVKNAVIVPTGAKGGFYPKRLPDPALDRAGWAAEGKASYQLFIRTLLSLTDNIVEGKVVHPAGVVIHDGEDPYFVVAADKGTASFSDVANAIAEEHDFWLGDAFASGGSNGYDHKAMGITARGAWLSVQRHFRELGVDVQTDTVRVVGCGDMSGDVFGNGLLLSKALKLVAAFDHRHVFIDPDPDPAASWQERRRMFDLPGSSWADYSAKLISKGGGVFPRSQKQIPLSPEARAALGIEAETLDPESLIRAILLAPADLIWFGGIGTYIKAEAETHPQVGDPANDGLRVDGRDIRARVIGEGANLGVTQAGRIEFSLIGSESRGGRINTDFIDNSAGVDCSDNEVNIKIALEAAKRAGKLAEKRRIELLREMTDDVAALVLEDNRLQALALSVAELGGPRGTPAFVRLMEMLEDRGQLDRRTEGLPDPESIARRAADGAGLTRPELAVLLSSSKLVLQQEIEDSALPDDPGLVDELMAAFPAPMQAGFKRFILGHRLRREIIATKLANRIVNRIGFVHPFELVEEEGTSLAHVAAAFVAAERLFGMAETWHMLETAPMAEPARLLLFRRASSGLRTQIADLIRVRSETAQASRLVAELGPGIDRLAAQAGELLNAEGRSHAQRMLSDLAAAGAPEAEAARVAALYDLDGAVGLAHLARDSRIDPAELTRAFTEVGAILGLDWAQMTAARMSPSDPWERLLVGGLARDFQQMRFEFLRERVARQRDPGKPIAQWAAAHEAAIRQFRAMIARAQRATPLSPAMLAQIASQARNLLKR